MINFLVMGRVCDDDDIAIIVKAPNLSLAKTAFKNHLKNVQSWFAGDIIYIEQAQELSTLVDEAISSDSWAEIKEKYELALITLNKDLDNLFLVTAYEVVMTFNPYDIAALLIELANSDDNEAFQVDQVNDDRDIIQDGEIIFSTEDKLSTFYYMYHSFKANLKKTLLFYTNSYQLHVAIGDDPKNSDLKFSELTAFPKDKVA
jgi:hypothetical protein